MWKFGKHHPCAMIPFAPLGGNVRRTNGVQVVPILLILFALVVSSFAGTDSLFAEANRLYDEQLYDSAATLYSDAIRTGGESSVIYFNLGNCSYRLGRIGEAILYNEKALRLAPEDEEIIANLKYLQTQIVDEMPVVESNPIADAVKAVHTMFTLEQELWIAIALSFLLLAFVAQVLFKDGAHRIWGIYAAGAVLLVLLLVGGSAFVKVRTIETVNHGVVLTESVEARSEPGGGQLIFTAHEGTKMQILSVHGNWLFVSLPNGASGYVREKSLGRI